VILVIAAALAAVLLVALGRALRRAGGSATSSEAMERARQVAEAALLALLDARAEAPSLSDDDLKVRALMAASGESELQARQRLAKAKETSALHGTLQMLVVGVAVRKERELLDQIGSERLMKNIVEAQKTVMGLIPGDL
jgi:hypothetical protein